MKSPANIVEAEPPEHVSLQQHLFATISSYGWEEHEISYEIDETIFSEGGQSKSIAIVKHGTVALYRRHMKKNNLMISVCCDGDALGLETLYGRQHFSCTAVAKKPTSVLHIPRDEFLAALEHDSKLMFAVLREYGSQSKMLDRRFVGVARMSSRARLCDLLLLIESRIGVDEHGNLNAILRGKDLAELAASAEETIYRIVAKLESDDLLRYNRGRVRLLNRQQLRHESSRFSS